MALLQVAPKQVRSIKMAFIPVTVNGGDSLSTNPGYEVGKSVSSSSFTTEKHSAIHHDTSEVAGPVYPVERQHQAS